MARSDGLAANIVQQNGKKIFVGQVTLGASGAVYNIPTNSAGQMVCNDGVTLIPSDALLMFQPNQDAYYNPVKNGAASAVTANNAVRVVQYQQEFFHLRPKNGSPDGVSDAAIDVMAANSANTGTANLFLVI